MSGIILLSSKGKAPGLLRLRLATASLLAMTGEKTFYEAVNFDNLVKSPKTVMPDLIRHPEVIEFTGFRLSPE